MTCVVYATACSNDSRLRRAWAEAWWSRRSPGSDATHAPVVVTRRSNDTRSYSGEGPWTPIAKGAADVADGLETTGTRPSGCELRSQPRSHASLPAVDRRCRDA